MKHVDTIKDLIELLGGASSLSRRLGIKNASTVSEMKRRGTIPVVYWPEIVRASKDSGLEGVNYDFLVGLHTENAA